MRRASFGEPWGTVNTLVVARREPPPPSPDAQAAVVEFNK
jgi:hypothetical protein